jgi:tetratricopeptide (TPR) repeat protein
VEEKLKAACLADLAFFHTEAEEKPDNDYSVPIAYLNIKLGEYTDAITAAEAGLKRAQFCTHLQVLLAEAYMHVGRKDEAREILFDVVVSDEDNYKAYKLLGVIFKSEADNDNAIKYLRAAYMKAPEDTELLAWLEDIGGLSNFTDKVAVVEDALGEDVFDYDADEPKFETQALLSSAETALGELSREINNYKQQGKTLDHMISDHNAAFAREAAEQTVAAKTDEPNDDETIDKAADLSNEDILKALADANITPESNTPPHTEELDYSDILAVIDAPTPEEIETAETEEVREEAEPTDLAAILSRAAEQPTEHEDDAISAIARAAESFIEEGDAETEEETSVYNPLYDLPEIPLPPTDPTVSETEALDVDSEALVSEAVDDRTVDRESVDNEAVEVLAAALNAMHEEAQDDGETIPLDNLSALNEPVLPSEMAALDYIPKELSEEEEEQPIQTIEPIPSVEHEHETEKAGEAPFIPEDLLDAVFREGGVDVQEVFAEDSEKIDDTKL